MVSDGKKKLEQSANQQTNESSTPILATSGLTSLMAGALAIALCRIKAAKDQVRDSRICILTAGKENPAFYSSQYMNFMNVYFSAQKMVSTKRIFGIFLPFSLNLSLSLSGSRHRRVFYRFGRTRRTSEQCHSAARMRSDEWTLSQNLKCCRYAGILDGMQGNLVVFDDLKRQND